MTIISATFANPENSTIVLDTIEAGLVMLPMPPHPDTSGGWRPIYEAWSAEGNLTGEFEIEAQPLPLGPHLAQWGYDVLALLNLSDLQLRLAAASIPLPPKAQAVREWITATQLKFATGEPLDNAPYDYSEVITEVAPLLLTP